MVAARGGNLERPPAQTLATNVTQTARTNSDGVYSVPALEPGTYRVRLEKEGFNKETREPIKVESSSTVALDFNLSVGNTSTEVTVTAQAPIIQEASSTVQYRTDLKQITFTVSWTGNTGRSYTRSGSTYVGKNGLYVTYQRS